MAFPTDPKFVSRAERSLGRRLPKAIVARLIRLNGGSVVVEGDEWLMHPVLDDSDRRRLKRTANDIVRETAAAREWPSFPLAGVSIGANGVGDHLVLLPAAGVEVFAEPIYMWEHETGELREIARSFGDIDAAG